MRMQDSLSGLTESLPLIMIVTSFFCLAPLQVNHEWIASYPELSTAVE